MGMFGFGASLLGRAFGAANKLNKAKGLGGAVNTAFNAADNIATAAAIPYGLYQATQLPGNMVEGIIAGEPNAPDKPGVSGFKFNPIQQGVFGLTNTLGMTNITEESVEKKFLDRKRKELAQKPLISQRLATLNQLPSSIDLSADLTGQGFLNQTQEKADSITELKEAKKIGRSKGIDTSGMTTVDQISTALRGLPTSPESLLRRQQMVDDRNRTDSIQARIDSNNLALAGLQAQSAQADRTQQIQLMQLGNQDRRFERESRRDERADQQKLYAMLLQSLGNIRF